MIKNGHHLIKVKDATRCEHILQTEKFMSSKQLLVLIGRSNCLALVLQTANLLICLYFEGLHQGNHLDLIIIIKTAQHNLKYSRSHITSSEFE